MNVKALTKEELYELIGLYYDGISNLEMEIEETYADMIKETLTMQLQKYKKTFHLLIIEKDRRIEEGEIVTLSSQQYEEAYHDTEFFKDISVVFTTSHFQRVVSGEIDQDYDVNLELHVETSNDRYSASIQLPAGFKSGHLLKREGNCIFYTGIENDYDFEIYYEKNSISKIIIYQNKSGASFIYT